MRLQLHSAVWPEVEATLTACNIRNFTIWLQDDLLVSAYEYVGTDFAADMARMAAGRAAQRWSVVTDPCQDLPAGTPEGEQCKRLAEVCHVN